MLQFIVIYVLPIGSVYFLEKFPNNWGLYKIIMHLHGLVQTATAGDDVVYRRPYVPPLEPLFLGNRPRAPVGRLFLEFYFVLHPDLYATK